nr:ribonuclease H-like domain-containing protein [Tanacetum cinerariifolium]
MAEGVINLDAMGTLQFHLGKNDYAAEELKKLLYVVNAVREIVKAPETSNPLPLVPPPTQQIPHTISSIKLLILKKGEYGIWAMKMEHYLSHTDYPIWQVIQNDNGLVSVTTDTNEMIKLLPPKTAEEVVAKERERKARTTFLMALLEDHLVKFHKMADAKEMWEAIKSRFGSNDESKKMKKYLLKQQFKGFSMSALEGLHKGYDRFQILLSQLEIHGAGISHEDANQKFLRSIPSSWFQVALIIRNKPGLDTFSFDDLYNSLRVLECDVKSTTRSSSSNIQNINNDDIETMDLKWQVAMISMMIKKFHKRTRRKLQFDTKDTVGFDKTKVECFNCHEIGHFARDYRAKGNQDSRRRDVRYNGNKASDNGRRPSYQNVTKSLVTIDGSDNEDDPHKALKDKRIVDSGCSRHMTWNKAHLADYQEFKGGFVAFADSNGRITGKGKIKAGMLDYEDVYYVEELKHYNLLYVSQMCDQKNKVLFTDIDCLVLSPDFKLPDEN